MNIFKVILAIVFSTILANAQNDETNKQVLKTIV